jgi:hypothetical protein
MMRAAAAALALFTLGGCATFGCTPATIVVAETERRADLVTRIESYQVHPVTGRVQGIPRDVVERTWWVRAVDGEWIAVDEATWQRAEKGKPLDVCR